MSIDAGAKPSWGKRLSGVEGLRGLAAVLVILTHTRQFMAPTAGGHAFGSVLDMGAQGLTLFFALSGFLLYRPFATAILFDCPFPAVGRYAANRALRIFPAYLVIFLLVAFVAGAASLRPADLGELGGRADHPVGYLSDPFAVLTNLFMVQTLFPSTVRTGLPAAWSLTVEMTFYIVMPVLAAFCVRGAKSQKARSALAALPAAAMIGIAIVAHSWFSTIATSNNAAEVYWLQWGGNWDAVLARSFLYHADLFAYGMLAAILFAMANNGSLSLNRLQNLKWAALAVGAVLVPVGWKINHISMGFGVLSAALILVATTPTRKGKENIVTRILEAKVLRYAGLISFSAYLWHEPVIVLLQRFEVYFPDTIVGFVMNAAVVVSLTGALSVATYVFVEKPPLKLKKRTDSRREMFVGPRHLMPPA